MVGGIGFEPIPRTPECHNIFNVKIAVTVLLVGRVGLEPTCFCVSGLQPPAVAAVPPADIGALSGIRTPNILVLSQISLPVGLIAHN